MAIQGDKIMNLEDGQLLYNDLRRRNERNAGVIEEVINTPSAVQTFDDGADGLPMALTVGIEPVQDLHGYDNPWPAGAVNLIPDGTNIDNGYTDGKFMGESGVGTTNDSYYISEYFPVSPSTVYMLSQSGSAINAPAIYFYDSEKNGISGTKFGNQSSVQVTTPSNAAYARCSQSKDFSVRIIQFEKGSTATTPRPYSNICPISGWTGANVTVSPTSSPDDPDKEVYPITFPDSAGTVYGGTLTVNKDGSGELVVDREYLEFDGSNDEQWAVITGTYNYFRLYLPDSNYVNSDSSTKEKSNSLNWTGSLAGTNQGIGIRIVNNRDLRLRYVIDNTLTVSDLQTYLASNLLQIVVEILEPVIYQLTAQQVKSLLGLNNVWADTGDILSVTYPADTKLYIDKKFAELSAAITALGT